MKRLDVKIVISLAVTLLMPLAFSVYVVQRAIETSLGLGVNPMMEKELSEQLDIHRNFIKQKKTIFNQYLHHLADSHALALAIDEENSEITKLLENFCIKHNEILSVSLSFDKGGKNVKFTSKKPDSSLEKHDITAIKNIEGKKVTFKIVYGVDPSIFTRYQKTGLAFSTYSALVKAPPAYLKDRFILVYLGILGIIGVASIWIGIFWSRRLVSRIYSLSRATSQVARGNLTVRVDPGPMDEVGNLVASFNAMVTELGVNRSRIEYLQKISAWQEIARRLAHEIKNPLTPIQLAAQQMRDKYDGEDDKFKSLLVSSTGVIEEEVAQLKRLTSDFSAFAKLPRIQPEPVSLIGLIQMCESSLSGSAEKEGINLTFEKPDTDITVNADRIMMKQVLDNLVLNAIQALKESDTSNPLITLSTKTVKINGSSQAQIDVRDNGPGIDTDKLLHIFEPYYTTRNKGTGLGLAISKKIILEHGGKISAEAKPGHGAVFSILLPVKNITK